MVDYVKSLDTLFTEQDKVILPKYIMISIKNVIFRV